VTKKTTRKAINPETPVTTVHTPHQVDEVETSELVPLSYFKTGNVSKYLEHKTIINIWNRLLKMAASGEFTAIQYVLNRCLPPQRKGAPIPIKLGPMKTLDDVDRAFDNVARGIERAEISPEEALTTARFLVEKRNTLFSRDVSHKFDDVFAELTNKGLISSRDD